MSWDDDASVREQYRTSANLATRTSVWVTPHNGRTPQDITINHLKAARVTSILDVGAGRGQLAEQILAELVCDVVTLDSSIAMAADCAARGLSAVQGDARRLPFEANQFDAVVATWMLYHVAPVEDALVEFGRVLRPGGTLVAVTNGREHLSELWCLAGVDREVLPFSRENGKELLSALFHDVQREDIETTAHFATRESAVSYLASANLEGEADRLPVDGWPRKVSGATSLFVATARR